MRAADVSIASGLGPSCRAAGRVGAMRDRLPTAGDHRCARLAARLGRAWERSREICADVGGRSRWSESCDTGPRGPAGFSTPRGHGPRDASHRSRRRSGIAPRDRPRPTASSTQEFGWYASPLRVENPSCHRAASLRSEAHIERAAVVLGRSRVGPEGRCVVSLARQEPSALVVPLVQTERTPASSVVAHTHCVRRGSLTPRRSPKYRAFAVRCGAVPMTAARPRFSTVDHLAV